MFQIWDQLTFDGFMPILTILSSVNKFTANVLTCKDRFQYCSHVKLQGIWSHTYNDHSCVLLKVVHLGHGRSADISG